MTTPAPFVDGRLFVGGALSEGSRSTPVRAPFDDAVIADVQRADAAILERALAIGVAAEPVMAQLPTHERRTILRRIAEGIRTRGDQLAHTIVLEAGKPLKYARSEVERGAQTFDFAADCAWRLGDEAIPLDAVPPGLGRYGIVRRFPVGLCAAVSPFNFPLNLVAHKLAPAFAAGCPVVLKPASQTPLTALLLARICQEAGLPDGGLSVLPCDRTSADLLVTDPRPKVLSFTGSADVGWDLKARAGRKRVVLELGGNAAVVVHDDADVDWAVRRITTGAFAYAGQICISVQRIYIHQAIFDDVQERLVAAAAAVPSGDPMIEATECGPLIDDTSVARCGQWIAEAKTAGARVLCGGRTEKRVFAPTLIEGATLPHRVVRDEAFAPVACLFSFTSLDDAITAVNDSSFGLQAGIFTDSLNCVWRFYEGAQVGGVIHNDAPIFRVDHMPYGGVKDSGFGREGLPSSLHDYTEPRLLALRPG